MHDIQRFGSDDDGGVCAPLEREPQKQAKKLDAFDVLQRETSQRVAPPSCSCCSNHLLQLQPRPRSESEPELGTGFVLGTGSGSVSVLGFRFFLAIGTGLSQDPGTSHVDVTIAGCTFCSPLPCPPAALRCCHPLPASASALLQLKLELELELGLGFGFGIVLQRECAWWGLEICSARKRGSCKSNSNSTTTTATITAATTTIICNYNNGKVSRKFVTVAVQRLLAVVAVVVAAAPLLLLLLLYKLVLYIVRLLMRSLTRCNVIYLDV